ncbi:hypothetical protein KCP75_21960 [Salmonella enterica subsp. enterica]|nr:hypothetical protein KCP75_21960 [Salmonella enterica subsp. enterica]
MKAMIAGVSDNHALRQAVPDPIISRQQRGNGAMMSLLYHRSWTKSGVKPPLLRYAMLCARKGVDAPDWPGRSN